jgi:hypothetical protein
MFSVLGAQANCGTGTVAAPVIDSVSVSPNGDIIICWQHVIDPNLAGYNIWTVDNTGANLQVGTVAPGTNCFTYPAAANSSGTQTVQILIEAFDNCPSPGPFSSGIDPGGFVNTIYLQEDFVECTSSINLAWTAYDDFTSPVVRYKVFVSVNGAAAVNAGTTFGTTYSYPGITLGNTYDFYVVAVENGGLGPIESTSNVVTPDISTALLTPAFNYLNNVTVVDSQQVDIQFSIDTIADVTGYKIQRATSEVGPFTTVGSVNKFLGMDTLVDYSDTTELNTDSTSYFYRIEIVNDDCGFTGNYSNIAVTILVGATSNPMEAFNAITITEYKDWDLGVLKYDVYRAVGGVWEISPIKSLPAFSNNTTYVDDVSEVFDGNGEFCYKVIAVGKGILPPESSSNDACVVHEPLLYVPNAFSPSGLFNTEFKPVLTFANPSSYTFRVFSRWGEVIFETGDVYNGWNGRYDNSGEMSPAGVYFYVVEFESATGEDFTKRGTVTIVN